MKYYTIYGERCSGTNYLETVISENFNCNVTWNYGWKHFFGFCNNEYLKNADDVLFVCIVRNPVDWVNSFFREKHHLPLKYKTDLSEEEKLNEFLNCEFWSFNDCLTNSIEHNGELMYDRNIYTGERYKNIFELRHVKLKYMLDDLPNKVKNYIFIKYEDLRDNFEETIEKLRNKGLEVKNNINYPVNVSFYKKNRQVEYKKKRNDIPEDMILKNGNFIDFYEKKLNYV